MVFLGNSWTLVGGIEGLFLRTQGVVLPSGNNPPSFSGYVIGGFQLISLLFFNLMIVVFLVRKAKDCVRVRVVRVVRFLRLRLFILRPLVSPACGHWWKEIKEKNNKERWSSIYKQNPWANFQRWETWNCEKTLNYVERHYSNLRPAQLLEGISQSVRKIEVRLALGLQSADRDISDDTSKIICYKMAKVVNLHRRPPLVQELGGTLLNFQNTLQNTVEYILITRFCSCFRSYGVC